MFTSSITIDQIIDALAAYLTPLCYGAEIIRAQVNRVPMSPDPCVVLTELLQVDLETPVITYGEDGELQIMNIKGPKRVDVQIDFYGPDSGNMCTTVKTVYRTEYTTSQFGDGIKPLYCDDGRQTPLVTGEKQWESRWTLTASLQYNPVVEIPQEAAEALTAEGVIAADVIYQ